jgi:hypothetical protein
VRLPLAIAAISLKTNKDRRSGKLSERKCSFLDNSGFHDGALYTLILFFTRHFHEPSKDLKTQTFDQSSSLSGRL